MKRRVVLKPQHKEITEEEVKRLSFCGGEGGKKNNKRGQGGRADPDLPYQVKISYSPSYVIPETRATRQKRILGGMEEADLTLPL